MYQIKQLREGWGMNFSILLKGSITKKFIAPWQPAVFDLE